MTDSFSLFPKYEVLPSKLWAQVEVKAVRGSILPTITSRSQMQVSAELPCVTGGQQASMCQHDGAVLCEGLPWQLEAAVLPFCFLWCFAVTRVFL